MSGTGMIEGGRALLQGRLFGFPVRLDISFVVVMALLGYLSGGTWLDVVLWLLITPFAVLTHELGHAFVARTTGARPEIALAGFGGVTMFLPPGPVSRARSIAISVAGPAVGLVLGTLLFMVYRQPWVLTGSWQASALFIATFTTFGWSVLNLLPVLPLDGGQAMRELLPGAPAVRERRAAMASVVVAALAAVLALLVLRWTFLGIFMIFFAVTNLLALRSAAPGRPAATTEQAVIEQVWAGRPDRARDILAGRPDGEAVDPAVHGAVLALTGEPEQGHAILTQERAARPGDERVAGVLALVLILEHDWDRLLALLDGAAPVPAQVFERAEHEARSIGRDDVAGRLSTLPRP